MLSDLVFSLDSFIVEDWNDYDEDDESLYDDNDFFNRQLQNNFIPSIRLPQGENNGIPISILKVISSSYSKLYSLNTFLNLKDEALLYNRVVDKIYLVNSAYNTSAEEIFLISKYLSIF
jgi:hypothetical protein